MSLFKKIAKATKPKQCPVCKEWHLNTEFPWFKDYCDLDCIMSDRRQMQRLFRDFDRQGNDAL